MKSTLFTVILIFIGFATVAQVQVNIFAGPQVTTTRYMIEDTKQKTTSKFGFQAGVAMKVPFENRLYFTPAIYYSLKGYKVEFNKYVYPPDPDASDNNVTLHTVELAPLLQIDLSDLQNHFFIGFGPSLDFQLFGREKFNTFTNGQTNRKMKFGFGDYGHYTTAMIGKLGYEVNNDYIIFLQFNLGLGSINNADYGPTIRHRVLGISFAKNL